MRKIKGYGVGDRAVIGRLKKPGGVSIATGEIALCDREIDASDIFALPDDISGLVAVGERTESLAVAVRARGISAVFVSQDDVDIMRDGERAVIYPERDTVFIAPKIEIVDDISTRIKAEVGDAPVEEMRLFECRELFSGKVGVKIAHADKSAIGEARVFEIYKNAANECELQKLVIILHTADFESADALRAHIKGMIRAAVYTKLVIAVSAVTIGEYERVIEIVRGVSGELREMGFEIPKMISCGAVINSASAAVCAKEYSHTSDLAVIECESLLHDVCDEERALVLSAYLEVILGHIAGGVREVIFVGGRQLIEKCSRRISAAESDRERSYFWTDYKNTK